MTFEQLTQELIRLYNEGDYVSALEMMYEHADRFPEQSARITFWKMCLQSLCDRSHDVLSTFRQGLDSGLWWHASLLADSDLDAVRDIPAFQALVAESQQKCEEARTQMQRDYSVLVPDTPTSNYPLLIALHGRNANKDVHLPHWEAARQRGWLVLATQSTQALYPGSYCWDDPQQAVADLLFYREKVSEKYSIDPERVVIAGFSQGGGMAIYTALSGAIRVQGFLGVASFWEDPTTLPQPTSETSRIRGYFIVGEKDHTLDNARGIQNVLKERNIQFGEEAHAELSHEFPPDFGKSFEAAINFIFQGA